jgi:hypothetical protein
MIQIPFGFNPRWYQLALYKYLDTKKDISRKALLVWPRQIGKDTGCFAYMLKEAARVPGNYFYVFPTAEEARRALWEKILEDGTPLLALIPESAIERISNPEMSITIKGTNSTIRVLGLDKNPNAIRGVTPMGVVLSEFAYSDIAAYRALLPALRRKGCWHILNSTPNGRNHFYSLYKGASASDGWYVSFLQALYPDKENYVHVHSQEEFKAMVDEGQTTWEDLEREFGCEFTTGLKGSYYAELVERAISTERVGEFLYNDMFKVDTFWDLGIGDSTAVWFRQKVGNNLIMVDYFEDQGKSLQEYVKMLDIKGYTYGTHYLPHDADNRSIQTGLSTATIFEDLLASQYVKGRVEVLPKLSIQSGIDAVRTRFSRYKFDSKACSLGIRHLELYHKRFDKRKQVYSNDPDHDEHSHCADALRMEAISEELNYTDKQRFILDSTFDSFD